MPPYYSCGRGASAVAVVVAAAPLGDRAVVFFLLSQEHLAYGGAVQQIAARNPCAPLVGLRKLLKTGDVGSSSTVHNERIVPYQWYKNEKETSLS